WIQQVQPNLLVRARHAWAAAEGLCAAGARPTAEEARAAAREVKQLERLATEWLSRTSIAATGATRLHRVEGGAPSRSRTDT
ncbi:MAG: hypothetical protein V2A73_20740, partial [Pseudomonadota bacterium]